MNALFIGGTLHNQELADPGKRTIKRKKLLREKQQFKGGGWTQEVWDEPEIYIRNPYEPVYKLKGYAPTEEDRVRVNEWLGY